MYFDVLPRFYYSNTTVVQVQLNNNIVNSPFVHSTPSEGLAITATLEQLLVQLQHTPATS